jgi:23S rRNA (adenine2030-N6)-methyltransferase
MNYRHAYHAGNFADCMKHALLVLLLRALTRKPAPLFVLDTHAGAGRYDLTSDAARETGEASAGIARLRGLTAVAAASPPPDALEGYLGLVRSFGLYPGSPMLARALLRPEDRMACCERHPEEHAALRALFRGDPQVAVHQRDGWESLRALLPPKQKRGLVLIDPPFEEPREFERLVAGLRLARARFPTGVLAAWYPIKHRAPSRALLDAWSEPDTVTAELLLRAPLDPKRFNGCGMLIVNPPYQFEEEAGPLLTALLGRLGARERGEAAAVTKLTDERR